VPELIDAGIDSFKIEGRMKSAYYTAVTANAYRMAIDSAVSGSYSYDPKWLTELESVSHREYCTGFYYGSPADGANTVTVPGYVRDRAYIGTVVGYDASSGRATIMQRNKVSVGDAVELITPGMTGRKFTVKNMKNEEGEEITSAPHPLMIFSLDLPFEAKPGDMLRA
ncbi:MAG: U32 family peptidase C-terminal domain-containing protein, partial [Firmicutes bacterium]|nr:U32 family peptidase C-terminal domain-containing protein [Candidatus Colimorpha enterica]